MVIKIVNIERFEIGQRPGLRGGDFRRLMRGNVILSRLNKIYINSSMIRRHGSRVIDG